MESLSKKILYIVLVHFPHKDVINVFSSQLQAQGVFHKLLLEVAEKYGQYDNNGASLEHCEMYKYYEIKDGYFVQLYETALNEEEKIHWL